MVKNRLKLSWTSAEWQENYCVLKCIPWRTLILVTRNYFQVFLSPFFVPLNFILHDTFFLLHTSYHFVQLKNHCSDHSFSFSFLLLAMVMNLFGTSIVDGNKYFFLLLFFVSRLKFTHINSLLAIVCIKYSYNEDMDGDDYVTKEKSEGKVFDPFFCVLACVCFIETMKQ